MSKKSREAIRSNLSRVLDPPSPRRRGLNLDGLLDEYAPAERPPAVPPVTTPAPETAAALPPPTSLTGDNSLPAERSQPAPDSLPAEISLTPGATGYHPGSQPPPTSLPSPGSQTPDMWAPFRERRGHLRQPHAYTDGLCALLDAYEQAVFNQLFRLSHGYGKDTCKIGLPGLARRANVGRSTVQAAVGRLIQKGLIKKLEYEIGSDKEQGTICWVSSPDSLPGENSLPGDGTIKVKALKENNKKGAHARKDYSACPDCRGTGMWYPEGFDKGVAKCGHLKLTKEG